MNNWLRPFASKASMKGLRTTWTSVTAISVVTAIAALSAALLPATAFAQRSPIAPVRNIPPDVNPRVNLGQCGHFRGHFGPLDYRTADPRDKRVVEEYHWDMEVQTFLSGQLVGRNMSGTGAVVGGFVYTLKAIPNHPAALFVMEQLGRKLKSETPQGAEYPLECWYMRAFMIAPDDPVVRAMYGIYLAFRDRTEEARNNLAIADEKTKGSGTLQYQIGVANLQIKEYRRAQLNALRATRFGFQLDGLEKQLRQAGKWDDSLKLPAEELIDPDAAEAAGAAASAASGAAP